MRKTVKFEFAEEQKSGFKEVRVEVRVLKQKVSQSDVGATWWEWRKACCRIRQVVAEAALDPGFAAGSGGSSGIGRLVQLDEREE